MNWTKFISWLTAGLVFLLTAVSIVLTYNALYDVAYDNGITGTIGWFKLAVLWPLTIDGALLVFSFAVVNASLLSDSTKPRWVMVSTFIILTIAFNFVDGGTDRLPDFVGSSLPFIVRMVPPISLALSFETLMSMLRKSIKRGNTKQSLAELETELETKRKQKMGELDNLEGQIKKATETLSQLKGEQKQFDEGQIFEYLPDNLPVEVRQQFVSNMSKAGVKIGQQANWLGVSQGTIKNDRQVVLSDNGNGQ